MNDRHLPTKLLAIISTFTIKASIAYIAIISTLMVRNVDSTLKEKLRVRAAQHGRSMEAELRHTLSGVRADERGQQLNLAGAIRRRFAPLGGAGLEPYPPVAVCEPPSFD